ncbi:type VII secretion protein EccE [Luedemannella helvata]|uniref:Type VII secretion protein EccE n=1 Tax=Luedemannella helvata TaxID=349315 RepID=A0ABP4X240_9ACTN
MSTWQADTNSRPDGPGARPVLTPRRAPGKLGPVHVFQLLAVEVGIVGVLAAAGRSALAVVVAGVLTVALLVAVLARRKGRWWVDDRMVASQLRRRSRTRAPDHPEPRLTALRALAPGLAIENIALADDSSVGVGRDEAGWFGVVEVAPEAVVTSEAPGAGVPVSALLAALTETGQPGTVLQIVAHAVPASPTATPAGQSYRQLVGDAVVASEYTTWMAVRLDEQGLAESGADPYRNADLAASVVATVVRRVGKTLRHAGVAHRVLDADGLLSALAHACDLTPASGGATVRPREEWSLWHSRDLAHRSFWLSDWPPATQADALLRWLTRAPATATTVSLVLVPRDRLVDMRCLVRLAAPVDQLAGLCQQLDRGVRKANARLFALDGEQGLAVYASAPTGGGGG